MSISKRSIIFVGVIVGSLLVLAACGGSDSESEAVLSSDSAASSGGSSIVSSEPVLESEAAEDSDGSVDISVEDHGDPPAISVVALDVPEAGSEEEALLNALDRQVTAINTQNWSEYLAQCLPKPGMNSTEQVKFVFEEFGGIFGYDMPDFNIYGYNARAVEFRIYSATTARTTFDIYDHENWIAAGVSKTWEKVDGVWLGDGIECYA